MFSPDSKNIEHDFPLAPGPCGEGMPPAGCPPMREAVFLKGTTATQIDGPACPDLPRDPEEAALLVSFSRDTTGRLLGRGCDWDTSPPGTHEAYDRALVAWGNGRDITASDFEPAQLGWLLDPGLRAGWDELARPVSFVRQDGDQVIFLDEAVIMSRQYPGWAARAGDPRLGKRLGTRSRELVLDMLRMGTAVTRMAITRCLNHMISTGTRPDLAGYRGLTTGNVKKILQRLFCDGLIYRLEQGQKYWKNRHWNSTSTIWDVDKAHTANQAPASSDGEHEPQPEPAGEHEPETPPPAADPGEDDGKPGEKHQVLAAWVRRQTRRLSRRERTKRKAMPDLGSKPGRTDPVSRSLPASPRCARPCRAPPRLAPPRLPCLARPCPASPSPAAPGLPRLSAPRPAAPCHATTR